MIGGSLDAFIGAVHRRGAALDGEIELVCGAFSSNPEKSKATGEALYLPANRVYDSYEEMILKEKDFREFLKNHDWSIYEGKNVAIICSEDAIIPTWAYMLLALKLSPFANAVVYGNLEQLEDKLYFDAIAKINPLDYADARVVVKGCSKVPVPTSAYVEITQKLMPHAKSLMFGEPCSTVPLYKKK